MAVMDPFANMPNADDSWNAGFSPAARTTDAGDIVHLAVQAKQWLTVARLTGLPMPSYVTMSAHKDCGHIGVQLASASAVRQWATRFGVSATVTDKSAHAAVASWHPGGLEVDAYWQSLAETEEWACAQCPWTFEGSSDDGLPSEVQAHMNSHRLLAAHTEAACDTIKAAACVACELDNDPGTGPLGHTYGHTCDTIKAATHRNWCGASNHPEIVPTANDPICCKFDTRNASNRPVPCAS